jgi:chromosome segregation ATPase
MLQQQTEHDYKKQYEEIEVLHRHLQETRAACEIEAHAEIERTKALIHDISMAQPDTSSFERQLDTIKLEQESIARRYDHHRQELKKKMDVIGARIDKIMEEERRLADEEADMPRTTVEVDDLREKLKMEENIYRQLLDEERILREKPPYSGRSVEELERLLKEHGTKATRLTQEEANMKTESSNIEHEIEAIQSDLNHKEANIKAYEEKKLRALDQAYLTEALMQKAQEALNVRKETFSKYQSEQASYSDRLKSLQDTLSQTSVRRQQILAAEAQAKSELSRIDDTAQDLQRQRDHIRAKIEELLREEANIVDRIAEQDLRRSQYYETLNRTPKELEALFSEVQQIKNEIDLMSSDIVKKKDQINQELRALRELEAKEREARQENQEANTLIQRIQMLIQEKTEEMGQVEERLNHLYERRNDMASKYADIEERRRQHEPERASLEAELRDAQLFYERYTHELADKHRQVLAAHEANARNAAQFAELQRSIDQQAMRSQQIQSRLNMLRSELRSLQEEQVRLQSDHDRLDPEEREEYTALEFRKGELMREKDEFIRQWHHRGHPELTAQLIREAEAVCRLEAAQAVERQQQLVLDNAQTLAKIHVQQKPKIIIDPREEQILVSEHRENLPDKEIIDKVKEMYIYDRIQSVPQ